jgi:hypothetical protein
MFEYVWILNRGASVDEAPAEEEPDDGLTTEEREAMQEGSGAQVEYQRNSGVINRY